MNPFQNLTVPEQVAAHLRREIEEGRLDGAMPGVLRLEVELGVNRKTVEAALQMLENDGTLIAQGAGKRRRIAMHAEKESMRTLRVAILLYEKDDVSASYMVDLRHRLLEAGHTPFHPPRTLMDLRMEAGRVARLVGETAADAWVVQAGSLEVLEWFATQDTPVIALFGRRRRLQIASVGPDKIPVIRATTKALLDHGHRRIVFLTRKSNRLPLPSLPLRAYLEELASCGIEAGSYHLPDWKETVDGLQECLESIFRVTRPTAVIADGVPLCVATQQFLASKKLRVPQDISLACTDDSPNFMWCRPAITHIRWDTGPVVSRIVRWAKLVSRGKRDMRQIYTPCEFVRGGTIGPVREG